VFAQDQFKATSRLTLNLGLRYDYSSLPQPTVTNPDYPATGRIPSFKKEFAPRLGFAYSLDAQSKTVIRGGYGMFHGRYPGGLLNTFFLGNGLYQKSISLNSSNASDKANGPVFPNVLPNTAAFNPPAGSVSLNMASADFRAPYTQQADIAIERQLARDISVTASYIWSRGLHLTSVQDINIGAPVSSITYRINDAAGNQTGSYTTPIYVRQNRVDPRYARLNIVDAGLNSWYNAMALQLNKRMAHSFTGSVSYTWSHAIDQGQGGAGTPNIFASGGPQTYIPGDYHGEKGTSSLDIRQRFGVSLVWQPIVMKSNNLAAKYLVNNWQFAVLAFANSSPHATPTVQVSTTPAPTGFTSANNGTLNGYTSSGLGGRVPFLPINSLDIGPQSKIDARLSKVFPIGERVKAMFTFDAFNVMNHRFFTSVNNRMYVYALTAGVPTLTYQSNVGQGTATQGFPDGTNARRLQIGIRLIW
jgi:hypothetical protein